MLQMKLAKMNYYSSLPQKGANLGIDFRLPK
jgi:hypothetical protein